MRRILTLFFCAGVAVTGCLEAGMDCCNPCCDMTFEVGAELLIMRPSRCDLQFAVQDPSPFVAQGGSPPAGTEQVGPLGKIVSIDPDYQVGFRIMAGAQLEGGCQDIRVIYTWLHTSDHSTVTPNPSTGSVWASELIFSDPQGPGGTGNAQFMQIDLFDGATAASARASTRQNYDSGDLEFANRKWESCKMWTRTFVGLHIANVDERFQVDYAGTMFPGVADGDFEARTVDGSFVRRTSNAWGIGPRFGGEGVYNICGGFGFNARGGMALLVGNRDAKYRQQFIATGAGNNLNTRFTDQQWDLHTCDETAVFPMFNARLGFSYLLCCGSCGAISLEAGYEWLTYLNMVPTGPHFRIDKGISDVTCSSYSLDGVYISILGWF